MREIRGILSFLLWISMAAASGIWTTNAASALTTDLLVLNDHIIAGTANGSLAAFSLSDGRLLWSTPLGDRVEDAVLFRNDILASTRDGRIARVDGAGRLVWTSNLSAAGLSNTTYGIAVDGPQNQIFLSTGNGLFQVSPLGNVSLFYPYNGSATRPLFYQDVLVVGIGDEILLFQPSARYLRWRQTVGPLWPDTIAVDQDIVVAGALDGNLHAFAVRDGSVLWQLPVGEWMMSRPSIQGGRVYAAANNGRLYAVELTSGSLVRRSDAVGSVRAPPVLGAVESRPVVFIGSQDRHAYALDLETLAPVWSWEAAGWVDRILPLEGGRLLLSSHDGRLHMEQLDRSCTITQPSGGLTLGQKDIHLRGVAIPSNPATRIQIRVNSGSWQSVASGGDWDYYLPTDGLQAGSNLISCQAVSGGISQDVPDLLQVNFDPSLPPAVLAVNYSQTLETGQPGVITVLDADSGDPVPGVSFIPATEGMIPQSTDEHGQLTVQSGQPGKITAFLRKKGYSDSLLSITVFRPGDFSGLYLAVAVLAIVILLGGFLLLRRLRRPKPPAEFVP